MDIVPVYILFIVAALGCRSLLWRNVCMATVISTSIYILAHSTVLPPDMVWPFDIKYLGYFGALMSGISAVIVSLMNVHPPITDDAKKINYMMGCAIAVSSLFIIQGFMNFITQLYFNLDYPPTNWANTISFPTMFVITSLQIILISKGGWDGTKNLARHLKTSSGPFLGEIYSQRHAHYKASRQDTKEY